MYASAAGVWLFRLCRFAPGNRHLNYTTNAVVLRITVTGLHSVTLGSHDCLAFALNSNPAVTSRVVLQLHDKNLD